MRRPAIGCGPDHRSSAVVWGLAACLLCVGSPGDGWAFQSAATATPGVIQFDDATSASGIGFVHDDGAELEGYLVSLMGSGVGTLDYDRDGWIDIYLLNGTPLPPGRAVPGGLNGLYRNISSRAGESGGGLKFVDASGVSRAGLERQFSLGTAIADFDNDGFDDIAVSNFGSISLLWNAGDGTFVDLTKAVGLAEADIAFGAGVAWLDIDNDGDLDLYVADYVDFNWENYEQQRAKTYPYPPGPDHYPHRPDRLFRNEGDGTFVDISLASGIADVVSPSMGVICGDFDQDGDIDIFVCCDAVPNRMFVNDGKGVFTQDAEFLAVAYNAHGIPLGSMGVDAGDLNRDGYEDLFITSYSAQLPILFQNLGGPLGFQDITTSSRAGRDVGPHANWGVGLVDFDNDGDRDLMIANGHLFKWAHEVERLTHFKVANAVLANDGRGRFTNVTSSAGEGLKVVESSRGMAFDDFDNDGDIDVIVLNSDSRVTLLENRCLPQPTAVAHWLQLQLIGTQSNRSAVGAKITVVSGDLVQHAEVRSGRGYQSDYGRRIAFGLGSHKHIDRVTIAWSGMESVYENLQVNQLHVLRQPGD